MAGLIIFDFITTFLFQFVLQNGLLVSNECSHLHHMTDPILERPDPKRGNTLQALI